MTLRDDSRLSSAERSFIRRALVKVVGIYLVLFVACAGLTAAKTFLRDGSFGNALAAEPH